VQVGGNEGERQNCSRVLCEIEVQSILISVVLSLNQMRLSVRRIYTASDGAESDSAEELAGFEDKAAPVSLR
jgi:hypothetical protein